MTDTGSIYTMSFSDEIVCAAGDRLQLWVTCPQGGLQIRGDAMCYMIATRVSA